MKYIRKTENKEKDLTTKQLWFWTCAQQFGMKASNRIKTEMKDQKKTNLQLCLSHTHTLFDFCTSGGSIKTISRKNQTWSSSKKHSFDVHLKTNNMPFPEHRYNHMKHMIGSRWIDLKNILWFGIVVSWLTFLLGILGNLYTLSASCRENRELQSGKKTNQE